MLTRIFFLTALLGHGEGHGAADGGRSSGWKRAPRHDIKGSDVEYMVDGKTYQGYLALPQVSEAVHEKAAEPAGVLIAHQYMGLGEMEKGRADEMAAMGYAAFALDVYGKGIRCNTTTCAGKTMHQALSNITHLRGLIAAGTYQLTKHADSTRLVAMGYCFGGSMVLELARHPAKGASDGVSYLAVSSIHGTLSPYSGEAAAKGEVTARVQAHHAELDFQGDGALTALEAELKLGMTGTDAVWETHKYAKCQHGWTEPGTPVYRARAAVQAHKSTFEFFEMAFGDEDPAKDAFPTLPFCQPVTSSHTSSQARTG